MRLTVSNTARPNKPNKNQKIMRGWAFLHDPGFLTLVVITELLLLERKAVASVVCSRKSCQDRRTSHTVPSI